MASLCGLALSLMRQVENTDRVRLECKISSLDNLSISNKAEEGVDGAKCRIPDDCIDEKRYPLFMARAVLKELIESLQSTGSEKP